MNREQRLRGGERIAQGPDNLEEELESLFRDMVAELATLMVNIGIIQSISGRWPLEIRQNWRDRVADVQRWAEECTNEVQQFATSYEEG